MFKEILKASRNNQASIFAFTFKFKITIGLATKFVPFFSRYILVYFPTHFLFIISYEACMIYVRALYGNFKGCQPNIISVAFRAS